VGTLRFAHPTKLPNTTRLSFRGASKRRTRNLEIPGSALRSAPERRSKKLLPHPLLQPRHRDAVAGELVGALVLGVTGVALDPVPMHLVRLQRGIEALPELGVLYRLLVGGFFKASSAEIAAISSMRLLVV